MAAATASIPAHLADWFLVREQFEPIPETPGQYRLAHPQYDGVRRTRQTVHDLRRHGYEVQAVYPLDPALTAADPPQPAVRTNLMERRNPIAQAAATRSPQRLTAPTATLPEFVPQTAAVPAGDRAQTAGMRRSR